MLAHCRTRGAMIELFKYFNIYATRSTRSHGQQVLEQVPKDGVQSNSFYYRYARMWNNLPANVVAANSLNSFKNALDKHWMNEPSKYDHQRITQSDS